MFVNSFLFSVPVQQFYPGEYMQESAYFVVEFTCRVKHLIHNSGSHFRLNYFSPWCKTKMLIMEVYVKSVSTKVLRERGNRWIEKSWVYLLFDDSSTSFTDGILIHLSTDRSYIFPTLSLLPPPPPISLNGTGCEAKEASKQKVRRRVLRNSNFHHYSVPISKRQSFLAPDKKSILPGVT